MELTLKPRVKICCIRNIDEAKLAIELGASAIGLVSAMPSGPGVIPDEKISEIAKKIPPPISSFLLTSRTTSKEIIEQQRRFGTNTIQIVDMLKQGTYEEIRTALPGIRIVQVVHVVDEQSVDAAVGVSKEVDAILLDSGNPHLTVKELGGTGRTHNWEISKRIRESVGIPIFLAGGLNPDNVKQAIDFVAPFGVDVCTGVRTDGNLDSAKLEKFFEAIFS